MQLPGLQRRAIILFASALTITAGNLTVVMQDSELTTAAPVQPSTPRPSIYWGPLTRVITLYGFMIVGVLSVVCNGLNIWVFKRQRTMSPYIYMTALAICNFITGFCILANTIMLNLQFLQEHHWLREMTLRVHLPCYYVRYTLDNTTTYLLNALSLDRLLAIRHPMHRVLWCTTRRALICCVALLLVCAGINSHLLVRLNIVWVPLPDIDEVIEVPAVKYTEIGKNPKINNIIVYMRLLLQQLFPLAMMITTNSWTIYEIVKSNKFRSQNYDQGKQGVQCLGMTLGVIVIFVITQIPATSYSLSLALNGPYTGTSEAASVAMVLSEIIRWCNTFTNFFVYLIIDKKFRHDLTRIPLLCKQAPCTKKDPVPDLALRERESTMVSDIRSNQC